MRRPTILMLALAIPLITCVRASAQAVVPDVTDPQAAQTADQRKAELEKRLTAAIRQNLDNVNIELKTAMSGVLGPVVTGAPYSAVTTNESVQTLADGNRIVNRTTYNVARDGQGRVRREELSDTGAVLSVMIMDPVANVSYVLDPTNHTARKLTLLRNNVVVRNWSTGAVTVDGLTSSAVAVTSSSSTPPSGELKPKVTTGASWVSDGSTFVTVAPQMMDLRRESLGTQMMEGVATEGTRTVSTIPAGQIGNERPIDVVSEQWYSKDLQTSIMTRHSDPRTGETTYRVSNIRRGEPDPTMFQVPGDYTVKEPVNEVLPSKVVK